MCLYVTRRYAHADGRIEIASEWVYCRHSNGRNPCINVSRRDETVQVGSSTESPDLLSYDGASTISSSMPATPISAISPAGPVPIRYTGARYEDRSPSISPHRKVRRYRLSFNSEFRPSRQIRSNAPRPVILQPAPPSVTRGGYRTELPEQLRARHNQYYSDSEQDDPFNGSPSVMDRARAQDQFKREERQRQRAEHEASVRHRREEHNHQSEEDQEDEDEHKERMLDLQEQRTEQRMLDRERQREEARRQREEDQKRLHEQDTRRQGDSENTATGGYARGDAVSRRDAIERDQVERLRRQIQEGREREAREEKERTERFQRERREGQRLEYERQREQLRQRLEERELEARLNRGTQTDMHGHEQARSQTRLESARRDYEELDRRLRARETRAQIDGPRFGVRRNITAGQTPHLHSLQGPANPLDDSEFRRSRGHEVLEEARRTASLWDEDEDVDLDSIREPLITRRNTISGMNRNRETCYRQRMRRYPG